MNIDFSPEKSLFSLPVVQWCAGVSAVIAVVISFIIACNMKDYPIDLSGDGFNKLAEFYKVPISFLAIGLALVGLCGANHRSEQTKKQIERTANQIDLTNKQIDLTKSQNNFSNYYKHIEEFEKYCLDHENFDTHIPEPRKLYRIIYSKSSSNSEIFNIERKFIAELDGFIHSYMQLSQAFEGSDFALRDLRGYELYRLVEDFKEATSIRIKKSEEGELIVSPKGNFILDEGSWKKFFENIIKLVKIIDTTLKFDLAYESSATVISALQTDLSLVPKAGYMNRKFVLTIKPLTGGLLNEPINR